MSRGREIRQTVQLTQRIIHDKIKKIGFTFGFKMGFA